MPVFPDGLVSGQPLPDYQIKIKVWAILGCISLFGALVELVRRKKLKERYSFLWFLTAAVLFLLTLRRAWLEDVAALLGVYYPPTALFLLLVFFMILILIHFSTVISGLLDDRNILVQQIGILNSKLTQLEKELSSIKELNSKSNQSDDH